MSRHRIFSPVSLALLFLAAAGPGFAMAPRPVAPARLTQSFDADWRFWLGDAAGAEQAATDDSQWRLLNVPHDWSIEGPFAENNPAGGAGAFLPTGVAWYRRHFPLPPAFARRRIFVEFDGVMQNSDVWINGVLLGHRPSGYVSFRYELTGHLNFGRASSNVLAVRADTSAQPASRWYAGSGIYRHVRLIVTDPVHLEAGGTFVTTPTLTEDSAVVLVESTIVNQSEAPREVSLGIVLLDPSGRAVRTAESRTQSIAAGQSASLQQKLTLPRPQRWDLDHPWLYRALVQVRSGGVNLDEETVPFGIREARFEAATGFWLNGRNLKLKGVCLHQDASAFGVATPLRAWERRLAALKEVGVNAIRTAHNPPAPEFLDLCDRMGFLVMDELFDCWTVGKQDFAGHHLQDYHLYFNEWSKIDARDTVRRDRNHPSIILYSAGNEIHDTPKEELAKGILAGLVQVFHENDPTRPVTQALLRPNTSHDYTNGLADLLDVIGTNYRDEELLAAWREKPTRKIIGTEQRQDRDTWLNLRDHAPEAGQFLWSGVDYLGESRRWPTVSSGSGLLDRTGDIKPMARERQSWWSDRPMLALARRIAPTQFGPTDPGFVPLNRRQVQFADWTPTDQQPHPESVEVYSNCAQVELFLNGQSLGTQTRPADDSPRGWNVAYVPGVLEAVATDHGKVMARQELRTAGRPVRVVLFSDRPELTPDWNDVAYVTASIVDEQGVVVPSATDPVTFTLAGPGLIAAVDSADNASHEPFQASVRLAFQGRCVALIKAGATAGKITLTASAPGLVTGTVAIDVLPGR